MALSVENPRDSYVGNGTTTVFPLSFTYSDSTDVQVYLDDVVQATGFTVSGSDVTLDSAPAVDVKITLLRSTPLDQPIPFTDPQKTTLAEVERVADRSTRQLQEREEKVSRTLRFPVSGGAVPDISRTANTTIVIDAEGNPTVKTASEMIDHIGVKDSVDSASDSADASAQSAAEASSDAENSSGSLTQIGELIASLPQATFNFDNSVATFNFST